MGPRCPKCGAVYEWTEGEITEEVMSPKVYFCTDINCRHMWVLDADQIKDIQKSCGGYLESTAPRWDDGLNETQTDE